MRARSVASLVLDLVLGCAVVGVAVDVAEHMRGARVEVGRVRLGKLGEGTERFLESLQDRVFVTYYATSSGAMPSHLRQLELQVTDLLESMKDASGGMLDYQVIDPGSDPELADYAAKRKVAPVRVRHVTRDAYSEQEIWSTLETNYGPGAPAVIAGLESEHLPRLQHLLLEQLRAMESPRVPLFALAAREGFGDFRAWLSERGEVIDVDLDAGEPLPSAADVLFWMDPTPVDATRLDELDAFLDAGRSLVLAGGRHYAQFEDLGGLAAISMQPTGYVGNALWGHYGLGVFGELVLDERCQVLSDAGMMAPFRIICIANNQDFDSLAAEVNGSLMFELPNPFVMNGEALAAGGWLPEVLGTTSELTWTQASGSDAIALPLMSPEAGEPLPKQALIVWLRPEDPWRGSLMGLSFKQLVSGRYVPNAGGSASEICRDPHVDSGFIGQACAHASRDRPSLAPAGLVAGEPRRMAAVLRWACSGLAGGLGIRPRPHDCPEPSKHFDAVEKSRPGTRSRGCCWGWSADDPGHRSSRHHRRQRQRTA